jgi:hypothetical protein
MSVTYVWKQIKKAFFPGIKNGVAMEYKCFKSCLMDEIEEILALWKKTEKENLAGTTINQISINLWHKQ